MWTHPIWQEGLPKIAGVTMNITNSPKSAIRGVLFDAYGTLFDVYSVASLAEALFPGKGQALSVLWRDKQIEYTRLVTTSNDGAHYQPFSKLTRAALCYAIKRLVCTEAMAADAFAARFDNAIERLMQQYQRLTAYPECRPVLQHIRSLGLPTGILSNGDPDMLRAVVDAAGLSSLLDHVISVDEVRKFKTHPLAYGLGEQKLGAPAAQIVFVSSNPWDALGAQWHGYRTYWVNRNHLPFEELGTQPERSGTDLNQLLAFFKPA